MCKVAKQSSSEKDTWDKFEILGKIFIGLLVPIVIAITAYLLNNQISERARATQMVQIAIGVLQTPPNDGGYSNADIELRRWAVNILENPSDEHILSSNAAEALLQIPIQFWTFGGNWIDLLSETNEFSDVFRRAIEQQQNHNE